MQLAGQAAKLQPIVDNLDPVAGREAQHLIASQALDRKLAGRIAEAIRHIGDFGDTRDDRAVIARPLEGRDSGARARRGHRTALCHSGLMNFNSIKLVLHPRVGRAGREAAGTRERCRRCAGREEPRGGRWWPAGNIRGAGCARIVAQIEQLHLPGGLQPAGGINTDGLIDEVGIVEKIDRPHPYVEVGEKRSIAARQRGPRRHVGLRRVTDGAALGWGRRLRRIRGLGKRGIPYRCGRIAVVLRKKAIDIHAPGADCQEITAAEEEAVI